MNILIAGLPHTGTSLICKWIKDCYPDLNLPRDLWINHAVNYDVMESIGISVVNFFLAYAKSHNYSDLGLMNVLRDTAYFSLRQSFPNFHYVWKTISLQQHLDFWLRLLNRWKEYYPDVVVIPLREMNSYVSSMFKRYPDRRSAQPILQHDLELGYSLLVAVTKVFKCHVVRLDNLIQNTEVEVQRLEKVTRKSISVRTLRVLEKGKLTKGEICPLATKLSENVHYKRLVELSNK